MDDISKKLFSALADSCSQCKSDLLALSGGLDSTILGFLLKDKRPHAIAVIATDFVSTDLTYSQMAAGRLGLPLSIYNATTAEILDAVEQTIRILKNFNDIEIRNSVVMYLAVKWAKDNGFDSMITGDGADELFAGYSFLEAKPEDELEQEIRRICSIMHFPSHDIGKALGVRIESPFLNPDIVELAKGIPANQKVRDENDQRRGKWILRKTFEEYIPRQIAWRPKSPMQDGSGTAGLTGLFESVIGEEGYVEKKLTVKMRDNVIIRSRESMYYYEIFSKMYGLPATKDSDHPCPYCRYNVGDSKFCRMCGAFPV